MLSLFLYGAPHNPIVCNKKEMPMALGKDIQRNHMSDPRVPFEEYSELGSLFLKNYKKVQV